MGEDSAPKRDLGPWSLKEGLNLFENVCKATGVKAMKNSMKVSYPESTNSKIRYQIDEAGGEIRVFTPNKVQLVEVLPLIIKPKRAHKQFC